MFDIQSVNETMIFLDRDGTINKNFEEGPIYTKEKFELIPGAAKGIKMIKDLGLKVVVVTNQGGINHIDRDFNWINYREIEKLMNDMIFEQSGSRVDDVFLCHHANYENCECRKPKIGLLKMALEKYKFNPKVSYIIGDSAADIKAGFRFGLKTILVKSSWKKNVESRLAEEEIFPDFIFPDILEAAHFIRQSIGESSK